MQTAIAARARRARMGPVCTDSVSAGGRMLSMLKVNARHLTKSPAKAVGLFQLLQQKRFPAIVGVSEIGCGPEFNFISFFSSVPRLLDMYMLRFSARSCSHFGGSIVDNHVGGGVLLLVRKSLCVDVRGVPFDVPDADRCYIDGHVGVWQLVPKAPSAGDASRSSSGDPRRLRRVLIVSVLYAPPRNSKDWGKHRDRIIHAIRASELAVCKLRRARDAFHVVLAHLNAQDGGVDVPLEFLDSGTTKQAVADIRRYLASAAGAGAARGTFARPRVALTPDGSPFLQRRKCTNASKSNKSGKSLLGLFASCGMVPLNGIIGPRQPTTWLLCKKCGDDGRRCTHKAARMRNVNDCIFVPSECVVRALSSPRSQLFGLTSRRIDWAPSIDHAVTTACVFVPLAPPSPADLDARDSSGADQPVVTGRRPRLHHLPSNLRSRAALLRAASAQYNRVVQEVPLPTQLDALSVRLADVMRLVHEYSINQTSRCRDGILDSHEERAARLALQSANAVLRAALAVRAQGGRTAAQTQRVRDANREAKRALKSLKAALDRARSEAIRQAHLVAPKEMWVRFDELALIPGSSLREPCALLQRLNDQNGGLVTTQRASIYRHLLAHRREVFQIRKHLGAACENKLDDALWINSLMNGDEDLRLPGLLPRSAAILSAHNPHSPVTESDARRGYLRARRDVAAQRARFQQFFGRVALKRAQCADQCRELERDIEMDELLAVVRDIKDVGCGTDGVCAAILRQFDAGNLGDFLNVLRTVWNTGVAPSDWSIIRCLLHFKKGDEYHVENYRGLGISRALPKLLSLIMAKRLEKFVLSTNALSASQGGFLPHRGTPEQVIALTEACRAALRGHDRRIYLCFVDIRRAYDSVLHPILWQRCAEIGIGGRFLTTLQALYHRASAVLDIDGTTLPAVPLECGVLQGSPLSCMLFNIYIDSAIRALEEECARRPRARMFGIPLPRVGSSGTGPQVQDSNQNALDRLISLFFADDGTLLAFDPLVLQEMATVLEAALEELGFSLNASKTECMVLPHLGATVAQYETAKVAAQQHGLKVAGESVEWSDSFRYLGTMIGWRLDWSLEWQNARHRVANGLRLMCRAGLHRKGLSPAQLYKYAQNKILCYLNRPATISGAGGRDSSAAWKDNSASVATVLRTLMCSPYASRLALFGEFGVWDARSRIDMLLLRQFAKMIACSRESTHFRAMCLSFQSMSSRQRTNPEGSFANLGSTHFQPWSQHVLAAAKRFRLDVPVNGFRYSDVCALRLGLLGVVVVEPDGRTHHVATVTDQHGRAQSIIDEQLAAPAAVTALAARVSAESLRLCVYDVRSPRQTWNLPANTSFADALAWSPTVCTASHEILSRLGADCASQFSLGERDGVTGHQQLQYFAIKSGLRPEAYLNLAPRFSYPLFRTRIDDQPNEANVRRRPHQPPNSRVAYRRVEPRELRACYCCGCIDGVAGVYPCESLDHVLLVCPSYDALRTACRAELASLVADVHAAGIVDGIAPPDVHNLTAFAMLLRGATSVTAPITVPVPLPPTSAQMKRAAPVYTHDAQIAARTSNWLNAVARQARRRFAGAYQRFILERGHADDHVDEQKSVLCQRLLECIALYSARVFSRRRALLRRDAAFATRARDPPV